MRTWTNLDEPGLDAWSYRQEQANREPLLDAALASWRAAGAHDLGCEATDPQAFALWQQKASSFVSECLKFPQSAEADPPRLLERSEGDGTMREEWDIPVTYPLRATATVVRPAEEFRSLPGILALHSMGSFRLFGRQKFFESKGDPSSLRSYRQKNYGEGSLLDEWARRGCVIMAIDAMGFGERTPDAVAQPEVFDSWRRQCSPEEAAAFNDRMGGRIEADLVRQVEAACGAAWAGLIVSDDRRCLDFLATYEGVDAARLGCVGLSFGAFRANYLAALDDRIQAAASVCWMSTMEGQIGYNTRGSLGWFTTANSLFSRIDVPDLGALAAPRAFLSISGIDDPLFQPFGITNAHLHLRKAFTAAGCPEKLGSLVLPGGHHFWPDRRERAWAFLAEHLNMSLSEK